MPSWRVRVVRLKQKSPFINFDSVKLYGAIIDAISILYPEKIDDFLDSVRKGKIRFSSPMPVVNNRTYFPMPCLPMNAEYMRSLDGTSAVSTNKKMKRDYIEMKIALEATNEGEFTKRIISEIKDDSVMVKINEIEVPGVNIDRLTTSSRIYYRHGEYGIKYTNNDGIERISFIWDIFYIADDDWLRDVDAAMRFVGDMGVSKKMSIGYGTFNIKDIREENIKIDGKRHLLLSKYIPTDEEMKYIRGWYDISYISGITKEGVPFGPIWAIREGSVIEGSISGRAIDFPGPYTIVGIPFSVGGEE